MHIRPLLACAIQLTLHVLATRPSKEVATASPDAEANLWNQRWVAAKTLVERLGVVEAGVSLFEDESDGAILAKGVITECEPAPTDAAPAAVLAKLTACAVKIKELIGAAKDAHGASTAANEDYEMAFRRASTDLDILRNRAAAQHALQTDQTAALTLLLSLASGVQAKIDNLPNRAAGGGLSVDGGDTAATGRGGNLKQKVQSKGWGGFMATISQAFAADENHALTEEEHTWLQNADPGTDKLKIQAVCAALGRDADKEKWAPKCNAAHA